MTSLFPRLAALSKQPLARLGATILMAMAVTVQVPRMAHGPLADATAIVTEAPARLIEQATGGVAMTATGRHVGFDTNIYPGDNAMRAWRSEGSPYEWVGYYLEAPCHRDDTWSGKRERLDDMGWGTAVIYVGQQTWGSSLSRTSRARRGQTCAAAYVSGSRGERDAADAIAKTAAEGFPNGSVIFLDVERMEIVPKKMRDYYKAWTRAVLADGRYRPGIYTHSHNAPTVYHDVSMVFTDAGATFEPPFWVAGNTKAFSLAKGPEAVGHEFAGIWQGLLDVVRTHNGVRLPIDVNVAAVPSPSSHENFVAVQ